MRITSFLTACLVALGISAAAPAAHADRIKDLASVSGVRGNTLTGFGLVVGLGSTGDDILNLVTRRAIAKMLKTLGVTVDYNNPNFRSRNVASVMVTATLPPFGRPGELMDVTVSSIGNATSLAGGTLVSTPLHGADGSTWAISQGPITVGGYTIAGGTGSEVRKNQVNVGRIPRGATIERQAPTQLPASEVVLILAQPDFTTAQRMAQAIIGALGEGTATVRDSGAVVVPVTGKSKGKVPDLIASLEAIEVAPDVVAKVVIDERTGTIVIGDHVTLGSAAVAYGGLSIEIKEQPLVSQPGALAPAAATTTVVPSTTVSVKEAPGQLRALQPATTVGDVVNALNSIGAKPRDLVAILQALAAAGALRGQLEVL